uniref:Uncharacterized protein n=1 Tax=Meloidogyne enterolobii TaxID=390850 RepID=A0A6V7XKS6_MELEN|nr:unnamed protein product [Meloidogyne enterolobii]
MGGPMQMNEGGWGGGGGGGWGRPFWGGMPMSFRGGWGGVGGGMPQMGMGQMWPGNGGMFGGK